MVYFKLENVIIFHLQEKNNCIYYIDASWDTWTYFVACNKAPGDFELKFLSYIKVKILKWQDTFLCPPTARVSDCPHWRLCMRLVLIVCKPPCDQGVWLLSLSFFICLSNIQFTVLILLKNRHIFSWFVCKYFDRCYI